MHNNKQFIPGKLYHIKASYNIPLCHGYKNVVMVPPGDVVMFLSQSTKREGYTFVEFLWQDKVLWNELSKTDCSEYLTSQFKRVQ